MAAVIAFLAVGTIMLFVGRSTVPSTAPVVTATASGDFSAQYVEALRGVYRQAEHHRTMANQYEPDNKFPGDAVYDAAHQGDQAAVTQIEDYSQASTHVFDHRYACDDSATLYNQLVNSLADTQEGLAVLYKEGLPALYTADRCRLNDDNPDDFVGSSPGNWQWYLEHPTK